MHTKGTVFQRFDWSPNGYIVKKRSSEGLNGHRKDQGLFNDRILDRSRPFVSDRTGPKNGPVPSQNERTGQTNGPVTAKKRKPSILRTQWFRSPLTRSCSWVPIPSITKIATAFIYSSDESRLYRFSLQCFIHS